jgi:RNA polymerase sigma factor (sigma-70 family)
MTDEQPTVFVVDDERSVGYSIELLLRSVGVQARTFLSAQEFLDAYEPGIQGCLVLDVRMPGMSGMELQERLGEMGSTLPIIFVTAHGDVPMAVDAMKAGAVDFIQKPFRDQDLLDKVTQALDLSARTHAELAEIAEIRARLVSLTPRETEVMELVVAGKPNKKIARALGISQRTVEIHRARVMEKMKVRSVSILVQLVMRARGQTS